jgi:nitroreductase
LIMIEMSALDVIFARRAVREFTDEVLTESTIHRLVDAAVQAPSAVNVQPWAFVVIQDKALLKSLSDRVEAIMESSPTFEHLSPEQQHRIDDRSFNVFYNAGTLILICAKPEGLHPEWDCCFAGENLMLAARALGLGTCVIGFSWPVFDDPDVREDLGIPAGYKAVLPIIVGRPTDFPQNHGRKRPEFLSWKTAKYSAQPMSVKV